MTSKISILGCGWLGLPLAVELVKKGHTVNGSTTSHHKLETLREQGIHPFLIDISNRDQQLQEFLSVDVLIIAITSKSLSDMQALIERISKVRLQSIIFISSTSVYPFTNGIVTEETPTADTPLVQIEKLFLDTPAFQTTILRFGGLFGDDRHPGNFVKPNRPIDHPEGYINLIHRDDCISIIERLVAKEIDNDIFNACASSHPKRREFYLKASKKVGNSSILFNENASNQYKIIDSSKLKTKLNYTFQHDNLMQVI